MIDVSKISFVDFYDGAAELVQMYKDELERQRVSASGELSRSVDFDVDYDENDITLYFNMAVWWYYVEKGRRPTGSGGGQKWGYPQNVNDISKWIENKISRGWFVPRNNRKVPRTPKEIKRISYAIVQKIHKEGWYSPNHQGLHILQTVLDKAEATGLLDKMIDSVVKQYDREVTVEIESI